MKSCVSCKKQFVSSSNCFRFCSTKCNLLFSHEKDKSGCWIWKKAIGGDGYGRVRSNKKYLRAHRLSYITFKGEFNENLHVLHKCDNRKCINPDHLFIGTNDENQKDKISKGRARYHSRFSIEDIQNIRNLHQSGMTQYKIAKKYKCHHGHIWQIVHKKIWKEA